jgi:hypothetical protein
VPLIECDIALPDDSGDNPWLGYDTTDGTHATVASRDLTDFDPKLGRRAECVAPLIHRGRTRVRRLPGKSYRMALNTVGAKDNAER